MQIYYHCTYKGSPVGFRLGKLNIDGQTSGNIKLDEKNINQFIRNCFNYGTVRKACGVLPQEPSKFFLLAKKLTAQGKKTEEPEHYTLNIALVTDNREKFYSWLRAGNDSEQDIAETVKDSMEIDYTSDFGFTVRAEQAASLAGKSFKSLFEGCDFQTAEMETCVETSYTQTDLEKLAEDLQLTESDRTFRKSGSGKWVIYRKKKWTPQYWISTVLERSRKSPVTAILLKAGAVLVIAGSLILLFKGIAWFISFLKN